MSNVQLEFVKVVNTTNQSTLGILYNMYRTNIPYNDYKTTVLDPKKFWVRNESLWPLRSVYMSKPIFELIFVKVVNYIDQSYWGIAYTMYKTNIPLNDYHTAIPDPEKL